MGAEQQRLTPVERSNLVAYLDGELNEAESRAIATKLTQSPTARREVEVLERTWELLDFLPRAKAPEDFTEKTLTEIRQIDARGGQLETAFMKTAQRVARSAVWVAVTAVSTLIGFALTQWVWPNPSARLASELSIAEHLDEYRDVGNFEFLKELANSPEFGGGQED